VKEVGVDARVEKVANHIIGSVLDIIEWCVGADQCRSGAIVQLFCLQPPEAFI